MSDDIHEYKSELKDIERYLRETYGEQKLKDAKKRAQVQAGYNYGWRRKKEENEHNPK